MARRLSIVFALVALVACAGLLWAQDSNTIRVSAVYKTASVQETSSSYSMTFTARLFNFTDSDIRLDGVKLTNPSNTASYATWKDVTVPANGKVEISDNVDVGKAEYKRWKSGAPAVLYVAARNESGDLVATQVQATFQPAGW